MINAPSFTPLEQADRTKLFDFTVEQTLDDIEKIKRRYKSVRPMSEYACRYALDTVRLQEFQVMAQKLFLPNVQHDVLSLPESEVNPNSDSYAFLPVHPDDRTEYVMDGSFAAMSAQQEVAAKEYFNNNETDTSYEEELADNAEFLKENPDQVWPLSLGAFGTAVAVNYVSLEAFDDDNPTRPAAVWRGRPVISMRVRPVIASAMLYRGLINANHVNDNPYTDLTAKGARRKQIVMMRHNTDHAWWSQARFTGALRETSPKKLEYLQKIISSFVEHKDDNSPSRLW